MVNSGMMELCYIVQLDTVIFLFKQKAAYEMRISDWSSDVCSSDLAVQQRTRRELVAIEAQEAAAALDLGIIGDRDRRVVAVGGCHLHPAIAARGDDAFDLRPLGHFLGRRQLTVNGRHHFAIGRLLRLLLRSEEHTSELQSLMRISYAVFCL